MEKVRMRGRPEKLTDDIKKDIGQLKLGHKKWTADEIRWELKTCIFKRVKRKYPESPDKDIGRKVDEQLPGLSTIQKYIKEIKPNLDTPSPFDELWTLGSLAEHPIPPEAMPVVMSAYKKALAENEELTIREAQWIARLFKIIDPPELVWDWAWEYATTEWISEVSNTPFDTTELDSKLISDIYYAQRAHSESKRELAIWGIAEKLNPDFRAPGTDFNALFDAVGTDFNALMELNLSVEETEEIAKSIKQKKEAQNERLHTAKG